MSNNHNLPKISNLSYKGKIFNLKSEAMPQSTDGSKWMNITIIVTKGDKIHTVKNDFFGIGDPMADKFIKKSLDAFYKKKSKMQIIFGRFKKWNSSDDAILILIINKVISILYEICRFPLRVEK